MFLPFFACMHQIVKIVMYVTVELKRIPLGVIILVQYKYSHSPYAYFYITCVACYTLRIQWFVLITILLSGDIETNAGPETLDFCCWILNSITAHDLRISLTEAYNSIYKHDLNGIVETHLDSTAGEERLSLDGYSLHKDNHSQNVKTGGVGLYVKGSLPSKNHSNLVTLPDFVVCEI